MIRMFAALILMFCFVSCATPQGYLEKDAISYDDNTSYHVEEHANGFNLTVYYSRYQFIPESDAVAVAGKSMLTSIAYEVADKKGKAIEPINEQRIKISMGRNGFSGITSFAGEMRVFYKQ